MRYAVDIDGTVCTETGGDYPSAKPINDMVLKLRRLSASGHEIILHTARGTETGTDWRELTERQMKEWGVPYSRIEFGKPFAHRYVDANALRPDEL